MFTEKSLRSRRPTQVTAAFWCQLGVAGLLIVLATVGVSGALLNRQVFGAAASAFVTASLLSAGLLLALATYLAVTAFGLRRGSRVAYRLSLAGLVLPLLSVVAADVLGYGTRTYQMGAVLPGDTDAVALADRMVMYDILTGMLYGMAAVTALVSVAAAVAFLLTRTARRFFALRPSAQA